MFRWQYALVPVLLTGTSIPAAAQAVQGPSLSIEAMTDHRERGISLSRGRPTLSVFGHVPLTDRIGVTAEAVGLRQSPRADGADLGVTLGARYSGQGALRLSGGPVVHLFPGHGSLTWWDVDARADYDLGPATIGAGISYAPSQKAIGGDNLYLDAGARIALPGTPLLVNGGIGRSMGSANDPIRAARLRPGGDYTDYVVGVEYLQQNYGAGLRFTATSIDPTADRHAGSRLAAYLRLDL